MSDEQKTEWTPPVIRTGDRVYVCKNKGQMEEAGKARLLGLVTRVSGISCDILAFKPGASQGRPFVDCRHVDDPDIELWPERMKDDSFGFYKLVESEEEIREALRNSRETLAAVHSLGESMAAMRRNLPPAPPAPRGPGRPRKEKALADAV